MKVKSSIFTQASGSVGGFTWSHNRGGMYIRARATPTNPNSPQQQLVRAIFGQLAALWLNTLTALQRAGWDAYATAVLLPDRLGEPRNIGGLGMYIRSNTPRLQASQPRIDDPPTILTLPALEPLSMEIPSEAVQQQVFDYHEEPPIPETWLSEDGAVLMAYGGRAQNASINYFKGPYRLTGFLLGDSVVPLAPPFTFGTAFPFVQGQKVFARLQLSRADGRLSLPQFLGQIAANGPAARTRTRPGRPPAEEEPKTDQKPDRRKREHS